MLAYEPQHSITYISAQIINKH